MRYPSFGRVLRVFLVGRDNCICLVTRTKYRAEDAWVNFLDSTVQANFVASSNRYGEREMRKLDNVGCGVMGWRVEKEAVREEYFLAKAEQPFVLPSVRKSPPPPPSLPAPQP